MDKADAAQAFAAVGSVPRLEVLTCLVRAGAGGLVVKDIQERTGVPASTLAHHLKMLVSAGLVTQEKHGRETINRPDLARLEALSAYIIEQCCADSPAEPASKNDKEMASCTP